MGAPDAVTQACSQRVGRMLCQKWRIDALIGIGGMAAVYAATHRNGNPCAVKMLHPEVSGIDEIRERFLREAYIGNTVNHPNVIQVTDDDVDEQGCAFMVMELLVGRSLEDVADDNGGTLPADETLEICTTVLDVLRAAHEKGVIHRDIKPDNIFICNDQRVKVLDFGIARLREQGRDHTATGMLMGTPAYMSPEQALGRQADIGAHSDIFSVGAMIYKLLSGLKVHQGESDGEILVAAATRPPQSLAAVLPGTPPGLVRIVDKMLAYDIPQRYLNCADAMADIKTFLDERKAAVAGGATGGEFAGEGTPVAMNDVTYDQLGFNPNSVRLMSEAHQNAMSKVDGLEVRGINETDLAATREMCIQLERMLVARKQYGEEHPEYRRKVDQLFDSVQEGLVYSEAGLLWNLSPYAFHVGEEVIWSPDEPWSEIPYRAFASGMQALGLLPGLEREEFFEFIRLLTVNPREVSPENDLVTLLWESELEHVFHLEVDSFSEGDQAQREQFENQKLQVIDDAHNLDTQGLQSAWHNTRSTGSNALSGQVDILSSLAGERLKAEAVARVSNLVIADEGNPETERLVASLRVDGVTRQVLSAQFEQKTATTSQRFIYAASEAFLAAKLNHEPATVTTPLQYTVDNLAELTPFAAAHFVVSLCHGISRVSDDPGVPTELCARVLTAETMASLVKSAAYRNDEELEVLNPKLTKLFEYCDHRLVEPILEEFSRFKEEDRVVQPVMDFVARWGKPHIQRMGELFEKATENVGIALVRIMVNVPDGAGRQGVAEATRSPHTLVRVEALGQLEGVSSARVRTEMKALLEDPDPTVRVSALKAMVKNELHLAGPFLVMRIKSKEFPKLERHEREIALETVAALAPERAEKLACELLTDGKVFSTESHEETREIAAQLLADIGTRRESLAVLEELAKRRWKNSTRVREAATRAAGALQARWIRERGDQKVPPPGKTSSDMPAPPTAN